MPLTPEEEAYLTTYHTWADYLREEAANLGWNAMRTSRAQTAYWEAEDTYQALYGKFIPSPKRASEIHAKKRAA